MSTALSTTQHYPTLQQSPDAPDWKQLLAQRVEAHRAKSGAQPPVSTPNFRVPSSSSRASSIARAVASRYAEQPTYSEIMAATLAEHAAQEAEAAEYAAVQANRAYSQQVHWEQEAGEEAAYATDPQPELPLAAQLAESRGPEEHQGLLDPYGTPYPASGTAVMPKFADRSQEMRLHQPPKLAEPSLEELLASSVVEPPAYLPSKLIEFPRELVSAHKARPRLPDPPVPAIPAEIAEQESSQLRIFEVQPEATSQPEFVQQSGNSAAQEKKSEQPAPSITPAIPPAKQAAESPVRATVSRMAALPNGSHGAIAPKASGSISTHSGEADIPAVRTYKGLEWAAISLDKEPALYSRKRFATESDVAPSLIQPASIDRRVMAFAVDFSAVTGAFLGFLAVFAAATPRIPSGLTGILLAGVVYAALWLLYQLMFFSLKGATAGMLYARIALCTFNDQNPSRSALRRRLAAWWLSCLPLGLGFFWSFLDEDNLSWHDRMTGMYQRTY